MPCKYSKRQAFDQAYKICRESGVTDATICHACRVARKTLESWRWDGREPSDSAVIALAEFAIAAGIPATGVKVWRSWYIGNAVRLGRKHRTLQTRTVRPEKQYLRYDGTKISLAEACALTGVNLSAMYYRAHRHGIDKAISMGGPIKRGRKPKP